MSRLDDNISRCTYLHQVLYIYMSRLDDNISRCIYLHQVLYIYVKICIHVKQDFNIRIKIYVHVSRSACEYIKSNKYWSTSSYTDRQSNVISKFAYPHQDSHLHIKIRIYTSKSSHIHQDLYIEIVIGLYEVLSVVWRHRWLVTLLNFSHRRSQTPKSLFLTRWFTKEWDSKQSRSLTSKPTINWPRPSNTPPIPLATPQV